MKFSINKLTQIIIKADEKKLFFALFRRNPWKLKKAATFQTWCAQGNNWLISNGLFLPTLLHNAVG
jgi:hypothetical protein